MGVPDINKENLEAFSAIVGKFDKISKETKYQGQKQMQLQRLEKSVDNVEAQENREQSL